MSLKLLNLYTLLAEIEKRVSSIIYFVSVLVNTILDFARRKWTDMDVKEKAAETFNCWLLD